MLFVALKAASELLCIRKVFCRGHLFMKAGFMLARFVQCKCQKDGC